MKEPCSKCNGAGGLWIASNGHPLPKGKWLVNMNATWKPCECSFMRLSPSGVGSGVNAESNSCIN